MYMDASNLDQVLLDSHMYDQTSILYDFMEATPPMLCFNEMFECVKERSRIGPSIE